MIKIYIIITLSILYLNISYASSRVWLQLIREEGDAFSQEYPIIANLILFLPMGLYVIAIILPILHSNYLELFFLLPAILIIVVMTSEFDLFIKYFSHGLFNTCNKCNKIILFNKEYCTKCRNKIIKEKI